MASVMHPADSGVRMLTMLSRPRKVAVALALILSPLPANAQTVAQTFDELQSILRIGDAVQVTDSGGETVQGRIAGVSTNSISVTVDGRQRDVPEATIREIRRRRADPWWNGVLIGTAIGVGVGAVTKERNCGSTDCGEGGLIDPGLYVFGAVIGAGTGALADHLISKFDTLFSNPPITSARSVRFSAILWKGTKGLQMSVMF